MMRASTRLTLAVARLGNPVEKREMGEGAIPPRIKRLLLANDPLTSECSFSRCGGVGSTQAPFAADC